MILNLPEIPGNYIIHVNGKKEYPQKSSLNTANMGKQGSSLYMLTLSITRAERA
jgi:hypothetical protein